MRNLIDTSNLELLWKNNDSYCHKTEHLIKVVDEDDRITRHVVYTTTIATSGKVTQSKSKYTEQKFWCVGGPLDRQRSTEPTEGYTLYNRGRNHGPNCILVFKEMLPK